MTEKFINESRCAHCNLVIIRRPSDGTWIHSDLYRENCSAVTKATPVKNEN